MMAKGSEFWAAVSSIVASPVAFAAGLANGTYGAATGKGGFEEGFNEASSAILGAAKEFGSEHSGTLTNGVIGGAAATLGGRVVNEGLKRVLRS
jgi:hypothetical protein